MRLVSIAKHKVDMAAEAKALRQLLLMSLEVEKEEEGGEEEQCASHIICACTDTVYAPDEEYVGVPTRHRSVGVAGRE